MDNLEIQATLGTQDTGHTVLEVVNRRRKPKGQSRMDNLELQATLGTQDTGHTVGSK